MTEHAASESEFTPISSSSITEVQLDRTGVPEEELARAFVDACNHRDAYALIALAHERIVFRPSTLGGSSRAYAGHHGLQRWVAELAAGIPFQMRIGEVRSPGPGGFLVLSKLHFGEELIFDFAMIGSICERRVIAARGYLSDERMLRRLGLIAARRV